MDTDNNSKFMASLCKYLQSLCSGYIRFNKEVEVIGHIYINIDSGTKLDYVLNEQIQKQTPQLITCRSNSFYAKPDTVSPPTQHGTPGKVVVRTATPQNKAQSTPKPTMSLLPSSRNNAQPTPVVLVKRVDASTKQFEQSATSSNIPSKSSIQTRTSERLQQKTITTLSEPSTSTLNTPIIFTKVEPVDSELDSNTAPVVEEANSVTLQDAASLMSSLNSNQTLTITSNSTQEPITIQIVEGSSEAVDAVAALADSVEEYEALPMEGDNNDLTSAVYTEETAQDQTLETDVKKSARQLVRKEKKAATGQKKKKIHNYKERRCNCQYCGQEFINREKLRLHLRKHVKNFKCNFCEKVFSTQFARNQHQRTHTGERPYKCHLCPDAFNNRSHLNYHLRIHSGEKPYVCEVCGKGFAHMSTWSRHKWSHTDAKPYHCEECGVGFVTRSTLKIHMSKHTNHRPHLCTVCGKGFTTPSSAKAHEETHGGSKNSVCYICGAEFKSKNAYSVHRKTHAAEHTFQCFICGAQYSRSAAVLHHIRKVHKDQDV